MAANELVSATVTLVSVQPMTNTAGIAPRRPKSVHILTLLAVDESLITINHWFSANLCP